MRLLSIPSLSCQSHFYPFLPIVNDRPKKGSFLPDWWRHDCAYDRYQTGNRSKRFWRWSRRWRIDARAAAHRRSGSLTRSISNKIKIFSHTSKAITWQPNLHFDSIQKRELKQLNLSFVFFKRKFVWSEFKTFYFLLCIQNDIFFEHLLVVADFDDFKLKILVVRKRKKPFNVCSYKTCRKLKCILVCRLKGI